MRVPRAIAVLCIAAALALGGGAVAVLTDRIPAAEVLPAGCSIADKDLPGCRPTRARITTNTVALATVIVTPLATLIVAIVAVMTAKTRQTEQLDHERQRQLAQLTYDRRQRDSDSLRAYLDTAAELVQSYSALISQRVIELKHPGAPPISPDPTTLEYIALWSERTQQVYTAGDRVEAHYAQLALRLPLDHPIREAYGATLDQLHKARFALPWCPPLEPAAEVTIDNALKLERRWSVLFMSCSQAFVGTDVFEGPQAEVWTTVVRNAVRDGPPLTADEAAGEAGTDEA